MSETADTLAETLADLDVELVSALYRAAGEADAFDHLVQTLQDRYRADRAEWVDHVRPSVERQLSTIETILASQDADPSRDELDRAVNEVPNAAIVFDTFGVVIAANQRGEQVFGTKPGQHLSESVIDPFYRQTFREFLRNTRARGNQRRLILRLDPAAMAQEGVAQRSLELCEVMVVESKRRDIACVALRVLDIPWTEKIDTQLSEAFGMTGAECAIAREFYELRDARAVAEARGTSVPTVRTQLKAIYAKTQTANQAQLLHMLSLLAARAAMDSRSKVAAWSNPTGREWSFVRSDGPAVHHTWQGAEDGRPVLVIHGPSIAHVFPPKAEERFRAAGIKLHIISRPGFGNSGTNFHRGPAQDGAQAVLELLDHLGLDRVPVLAISTGLVTLAHALEARPQLASSIVAAGEIYFKHIPLNPALSSYQRLVFRLSRRAPRILATLTRIGHRNMERVGVDWYIERLMGENAWDAAYFRAGHHAGLIRAAAGHLLVQGPDTFARELTVDRSPALTLMRNADYPLLIVLPEKDTAHEIAAYKAGLSLGPHARIEVLHDTGELYFYSAGERLAELVIEHFSKQQLLAHPPVEQV